MDAVTPSEAAAAGLSRRRFLGYLLAAPTLVAGADLVRSTARAALPSLPDLSEVYDLSDLLTDAARPTANLITVTIDADGRASFALPRAEVGQGITTAAAMVIADELDLPIDRVDVTLADARPELVWNQITGGSNTMHAIHTPLRVACAVARGQLLDAAAAALGLGRTGLSTADGAVVAADGRTVAYGDLAVLAAVTSTVRRTVRLKAARVVGTRQRRVDAVAAVTGRKQFAMDLRVPGALPTMVCRPPTLNGTVVSVDNVAAVRSMPGVTDVATIPTGVAVRAATFGQCIDAVRALRVTWATGTAAGKSDADVVDELVAAELPLATDALPLGDGEIDLRFTFSFVSGSPLEPNCAVADVRADRAEVWSSLKTPIIAQQRIAEALGLPPTAVTCHVAEGGGSFGRHLFFDAALEAAQASRAFGNKPVKLLWHRTDDCRQGRVHPMSTTRVRATWTGADVTSYEQRHTSVETDYRHGLGELISATMAAPPQGNLGYAHTVFQLTQNIPYRFGVTSQLINEVDDGFNTSSMRNIYSPNVTTARELVVDQLAAKTGRDAIAFRRETLEDERLLAVLDAVAEAGEWGRPMAPGTAHGVAVHSEYKSRAAVLVEIDCRDATVQRAVRNGYTGPRVTKAVCAVDAGLPINVLGIEAQAMGSMMDGIALALTFSVHLRDGHFLEGSWDDAFYTRQWNVPGDVRVLVLPTTTGHPGGVGELVVAPAFAAVACAYARATGTVPTTFPINHARADLGFEPKPTVPPIPASPTDGLTHTF